MKFSEKFRKIWWILSIVMVVILIAIRWDAIQSNNATSFDFGLLVVFIALFLVPIFSEITFLGMSVKQKVDEAKQEIKQDLREQFLSVKAELQNAISVSNLVAPHFYLNNPPPDESLAKLKEEIFQGVKLNFGIKPTETQELKIDLDDDVLIAFNSRYQLEKEIRRIWEEFFDKTPPRRGLLNLVTDLVNAQIIPLEVANSIREVSSVASPSIHAESTSEQQSNFLKDVTPTLLAGLKAIRKDF